MEPWEMDLSTSNGTELDSFGPPYVIEIEGFIRLMRASGEMGPDEEPMAKIKQELLLWQEFPTRSSASAIHKGNEDGLILRGSSSVVASFGLTVRKLDDGAFLLRCLASEQSVVLQFRRQASGRVLCSAQGGWGGLRP
ncbi:hypothetical protein NDU88_004542 [Pleurodeles waltl]|uniref:Uncharacterized protein n=1 Tax=Pleurodeles waltl TaxID=8319 RepID=A0AAV7QCM3_PLEWA|nr:hypothetical protein NDU88_004542 [Pleurodeles waltl]